MTGSACQCVTVDSTSDSDKDRRSGGKEGWNIGPGRCLFFDWRMTGSACHCVTVDSSSDSDKGRRSGGREG